jgi:hypothetical protein
MLICKEIIIKNVVLLMQQNEILIQAWWQLYPSMIIVVSACLPRQWKTQAILQNQSSRNLFFMSFINLKEYIIGGSRSYIPFGFGFPLFFEIAELTILTIYVVYYILRPKKLRIESFEFQNIKPIP